MKITTELLQSHFNAGEGQTKTEGQALSYALTPYGTIEEYKADKAILDADKPKGMTMEDFAIVVLAKLERTDKKLLDKIKGKKPFKLLEA